MTPEELMYQKQILVDFIAYHEAGKDLAKANKMLAPDRFTTMSGLSDIEIWKNNKRYVEDGKGKIIVSGVYTENMEDSSSPRLNAYYQEGISEAERTIAHFMPYNTAFFQTMKEEIASYTHQMDGTLTKKELVDKMNADIFAFLMFADGSPVANLMNADGVPGYSTKKLMAAKLFNKSDLSLIHI